jgi:hypothetical protein
VNCPLAHSIKQNRHGLLNVINLMFKNVTQIAFLLVGFSCEKGKHEGWVGEARLLFFP